MMLFQQLTRGLLVSCHAAEYVRQVADNRSGSFACERAVVGDNYARFRRGDGCCPNRFHGALGWETPIQRQ